MDYWAEIRKLKGNTLRTLDRGNPFDVLDVTESAVIIRPHENMNERRIARKHIEGALKELVAKGEITRVTIRAKYSNFNPAYVAAILALLPHVTSTIVPIKLRHKR